MLVFVIFCNFILTILHCYLAFRLWRLYVFLVKTTQTLTRVEQHTAHLLQGVPVVIINGQQNTAQLRQHYRDFTRKLQTLQKILRLIKLGFRLWQRQSIKGQWWQMLLKS